MKIIMLFTIKSGRSMHSVLVGLLCLAIASSTCCSSSVGSSNNIMCLESERNALLQFKQGLVNESNVLASWESNKNCCEWRGIACNNQTGHVITLNLSSNPFVETPYLVGAIDPSLLELQHLNYLDLSFNDFGGMMIPKFIGSLSQLKELKLAGVNFSGPIPPQLGNLSNLHTLDLSYNDLGGMMIPKFIGSLSQLKELKLAHVNFSGPIPPQLGNLSNLHTLDLSYNDLGGMMIPKFIGSLSQLKELKLVHVNFSGPIPPQLGNLSNLHTLDLSYNDYVSFENLEWLSHLSSLRYLDMSGVNISKVVNWPHSLSKLPSLIELQLSRCNLPDVNLRSLSFINSSTSLRVIDLSVNALQGPIPDVFFNMVSLVSLDLSDNNLQGPIPDVFFNMVSLVSLDLSDNQLEGGLPKFFQNFCKLESLRLGWNQFAENIEDFIKTLSCAQNTLESLYLSDNRFWGSWPDLTSFSKLRVLALGSNQLNGSTPESVGHLSSLELLDLSNNSLNGVITEAHFLNLTRLQTLSVSGNHLLSINLSSDWNPPFQLIDLGMSSCKLGPDFPKWIQTQRNLLRLDLSMNQIQGKLPNMSIFLSLTDVDLSSNKFSGELPSILPNLFSLDLSNNMFSGSLSHLCVTHAPVFRHLDLSENLLSGELPNCWMQFPSLEVLNLRKNNLSGKVPSSLGNLEELRGLQLYGNNFYGELPSFEKCTLLAIVDLGANKLSGKIPTWINQSLTNLRYLRLRSNEFNGIIPFSLCSLTAIHVLDLSQNNISGALPHCFNNITALSDDSLLYYTFVDVVWKGIEIEFGGGNLMLLRSIDISNNYLVGGIPESVTSMINLNSLNLSRNKLTGKIPENLGNLKMLESLDLSRNQISGRIPRSFSSLNFLSVLDLSYNRLSGRIPLSTQLQSFNASKYMGNLGLCGPPLTQNCPGDGPIQDDRITRGSGVSDNRKHDNDGLISLGFFISAVIGFITGFWIVCGSLLLKSSWRYTYFKFLDDTKDWVYIKTAVYKAKMERRLQR